MYDEKTMDDGKFAWTLCSAPSSHSSFFKLTHQIFLWSFESVNSPVSLCPFFSIFNYQHNFLYSFFSLLFSLSSTSPNPFFISLSTFTKNKTIYLFPSFFLHISYLFTYNEYIVYHYTINVVIKYWDKLPLFNKYIIHQLQSDKTSVNDITKYINHNHCFTKDIKEIIQNKSKIYYF